VIVCHCHGVNDRTVRAAALAGADDVDAVGERSGAGTGCGGCHPAIERLLAQTARPADVAAVA